MKKYVRSLSVFLSVFFVIVFLITLIPISDEDVVGLTVGTEYEKVAWNIRTINDPGKLDSCLIFLGPSLIQGGINDSLLNARGIRAVNMGFNHPGYDIEYYFVKRILESSKPSVVFLHRPKNEGFSFHPMTPMLMDPVQYYRTIRQFPIRMFFEYIPKRFYFVLESLVNRLFRKERAYVPSRYGFIGEANGSIQPLQGLNEAIEAEIKSRKDFLNERVSADGYFHTANPRKRKWRKLFTLYWGVQEPIRTGTVQYGQNRGIEMREIYIPFYIDAATDLQTRDTNYFLKPVSNAAQCLILEDYSFLLNRNLWYDIHHVNTNGANILTDSLVKHFKRKPNH